MGILNFKAKACDYKNDENGASAVEFALIAIPFIYLLAGILEMCLMFAAGAILHGGTGEAGRLIRTGQIQSTADPQAAFEEALCDHVGIFLDCEAIVYEAIHLDEEGFAGASVVEPDINDDGEMQPREFDPGEENSVILIRAAYNYPIMTPLFADFLSDAPNNTKLFISTLVLKNEPYKFTEDAI